MAVELQPYLTDCAIAILQTPNIHDKVNISHDVAAAWRAGGLDAVNKDSDAVAPEAPARPDDLVVVAPGKIKRGKGGTVESRIKMLHSLANIESWAIDVSWDILCRWPEIEMPKEFYDDWVKVAEDECRHFGMLDERLHELGSHFGALPVHEGIWESAMDTADDLLARLAIMHMVHEARGLDVMPQTIDRFRNNGDTFTAELLDCIFIEEITHVTAGMKWFKYVCEERGLPLMETFGDLVGRYFRGGLKPPFNVEARAQAGMTEEWYLPLVKAKGSGNKKSGGSAAKAGETGAAATPAAATETVEGGSGESAAASAASTGDEDEEEEEEIYMG